MKNIHEVLQQKEADTERLKRELQALRVVAPLLEEELKRTEADKLQRNVERLATRDEARRESDINDKRSEPPSTVPGAPQLEEQIRLRAEELYEARGREPGHTLDDWLQAEAEILGTKQKAAAYVAHIRSNPRP
jgi:hypothetical protein